MDKTDTKTNPQTYYVPLLSELTDIWRTRFYPIVSKRDERILIPKLVVLIVLSLVPEFDSSKPDWLDKTLDLLRISLDADVLNRIFLPELVRWDNRSPPMGYAPDVRRKDFLLCMMRRYMKTRQPRVVTEIVTVGDKRKRKIIDETHDPETCGKNEVECTYDETLNNEMLLLENILDNAPAWAWEAAQVLFRQHPTSSLGEALIYHNKHRGSDDQRTPEYFISLSEEFNGVGRRNATTRVVLKRKREEEEEDAAVAADTATII